MKNFVSVLSAVLALSLGTVIGAVMIWAIVWFLSYMPWPAWIVDALA